MLDNHGKIMKPIPEYPDYWISEKGDVIFKPLNKKIKLCVNNEGYVYFSIRRNGRTDIPYQKLLLSRVLCRVYKDLEDLHDLTLDVDHIDTNPLNNTLDNLQVLTREEHIQKTLRDNGVIARPAAFCCVCGIKINKGAVRCVKHAMISRTKDVDITKEMIENEVQENGWTKAGKEFGLSDNGVRRRYKHLGGDPKQLSKLK